MAEYENLSERFIIKSFDYQKQFSHIYAHRLAEMTPLLKAKVVKCCGSQIPIKKLCDLHEGDIESCVIIGTIYKHQAFKPSILKEISEENQLAPQPRRDNYVDAEDKIVLEDELQRVRLFGNVTINEMATGVVCAVMGVIEEDGRFDVKEIMFYESGPQKSLQYCNSNAKYLVLMSGLSQLDSHNYVESLNLFQYWLINKLNPLDVNGGEGTGVETTNVRLIIAGNSLRSDNGTEKQNSSSSSLSLVKRSLSEGQDVVNAIKMLDKWFASWSSWLPLDLMPGEFDPANFMLPQQPFHHCMFPLASCHKNFQNVTNPYTCSIDNALIVGSSGQNIKDILRTTNLEKPLQGLSNTLIWGHLAPTAPDTLACYPYIKQDPFIIRKCPHVYFMGNCDAFATSLHNGYDGQCTRLVCIPSFAKTQSVAVVNLYNLECHEISFRT